LNTAVRPPAEEFGTALPNEQMAALMHLFQPTAEIIADFSTPRSKPMQMNAAAILAMLKRRPCTALQIAEGFGLHVNEVSKYLGKLMKENKIRAERKTWYIIGSLPKEVIRALSILKKKKCIRVSEWLVCLKTDVVLLRENLQGKGPAHVFANAGVETRMTAAKTISSAITDHNQQKHPPNGLKRE
jgi:hypothetical protein